MGRAAAHGPDTAVSLDRIVMTELTANFTLTGHRFVGNSNQGAWSLTVQAVRFGPRSNEYAQPPEPRHRPGVAGRVLASRSHPSWSSAAWCSGSRIVCRPCGPRKRNERGLRERPRVDAPVGRRLEARVRNAV